MVVAVRICQPPVSLLRAGKAAPCAGLSGINRNPEGTGRGLSVLS